MTLLARKQRAKARRTTTCRDFPKPEDAVRDPKRCSATTIKQFLGCKRQWAAEATEHCVQGTNPAFEFGTELHLKGEQYLRDGAEPDTFTKTGKLLRKGLEHLPKPKAKGLRVEVAFEIWEREEGLDPVFIEGTRDFEVLRPEKNYALLGDHKTISRPRAEWGLDEEKIKVDVQANLYAHALFLRYDWIRAKGKLSARWVYYPKNGGRCYPIDALFTPKQVEAFYEATILPAAREMKRFLNVLGRKPGAARLNEVPNNPDHCSWCGARCSFAEDCDIFEPGEADMGIRSDVAGRREGKGKEAAGKSGKGKTDNGHAGRNRKAREEEPDEPEQEEDEAEDEEDEEDEQPSRTTKKKAGKKKASSRRAREEEPDDEPEQDEEEPEGDEDEAEGGATIDELIEALKTASGCSGVHLIF